MSWLRHTISPHRRLALILLFLTYLILFLGILAVYNASVAEGLASFNNKFHFVSQQLKWAGIGTILLLVASQLPVSFYKKVAPAFFLFTLVLMVLVLIPGLGSKIQGARRWLSLGSFTLQPSELLKLSLIIYLAAWLEKPKPLLNFLFILGLILGLTMLQPDLGTAIILVSTGFLVFYLSGAPLHHLGLLFLGGISLGSLLILTSPYRRARLSTFLDPTEDPLGASYHINQVLLALGSGGLFGVGIGRSRQKYQYLPEATTDSIFAVIGEEVGFIGAITLLLLLLALISTAFKITTKARDPFAQLLAGGITGFLAVQILLNLAAMVALVPLTGIPLPLISYGGSSLITTLTGIGILLSISKSSH